MLTTADDCFSYKSVKSGRPAARPCAAAGDDTIALRAKSAAIAEAAREKRLLDIILFGLREASQGYLSLHRAERQRRATELAIWRIVVAGASPSAVTTYPSASRTNTLTPPCC